MFKHPKKILPYLFRRLAFGNPRTVCGKGNPRTGCGMAKEAGDVSLCLMPIK